MAAFNPLPERRAEPFSVATVTPFVAAQTAGAAPVVLPKDTGACVSNLPRPPAPQQPLPSMKLVKDISVKPPPPRIKGKKKRPPMAVPRRTEEAKRMLAETLAYKHLPTQTLPDRPATPHAREADLMCETPEPVEGFEKMYASVSAVVDKLEAEAGGELDQSWTTIGRWIEAYYSDVLVEQTTEMCRVLYELGKESFGPVRLGFSVTILEQVLMLLIRTAPDLKPILRGVYRDVVEAMFVENIEPPFFFLESTPAIVNQLLSGELPPPLGSPLRQRVPSQRTLRALQDYGSHRIADLTDCDRRASLLPSSPSAFVTQGDAAWGRAADRDADDSDAPQDAPPAHVPAPPQDAPPAPEGLTSPLAALKQQIRRDVHAMYPLAKPRGEWRQGMRKSPRKSPDAPQLTRSPRDASPLPPATGDETPPPAPAPRKYPTTADTSGPVVGQGARGVSGSPDARRGKGDVREAVSSPREAVGAVQEEVRRRFANADIYRDQVATERRLVKDVRLKAMRRARGMKSVCARVMDHTKQSFMRCVLLSWRRAVQSMRRQCGRFIEVTPKRPSVAGVREDEPLPTPAPPQYIFKKRDPSDMALGDFLQSDAMSFDDLHDRTRGELYETKQRLQETLAREAELNDMVSMLRKDLAGLHGKFATERDISAQHENTISRLRNEITVLNENVHQLTRFSTRYKDLHTQLEHEHNQLQAEYVELANAVEAVIAGVTSADEGEEEPHVEVPVDTRDEEWGTCGIAVRPSVDTTAGDLLEWLNVLNFNKVSCREATSWDQGPHLLQPLAQILNSCCPERSGVNAQMLQEMSNQECFVRKSEMFLDALERIGIVIPAAPEDLAAPASTYPASSAIYQTIAATMFLRLGGCFSGRVVSTAENPSDELAFDAYPIYDKPPTAAFLKDKLQRAWGQGVRWTCGAVTGLLGTLHETVQKLMEVRGDGIMVKERFVPFGVEELPDVEMTEVDVEEINMRCVEHLEELVKIFAYYAGRGNAGDGGVARMDEKEFTKFALDTKLLGKTLSHVQVAEIFKDTPKVDRESMTIREWMAAIPFLAVRKFKSPAMSLGEKVSAILANNILLHSRQLDTDQFRKMIYSDKVQSVMRDASALTLAIFKNYSDVPSRAGVSFAPAYMTKSGFLQFVRDASIQDQGCTAYVLDEIFRQIQDPEDDSDDLIYQEFCECLVAIAAVKRPEPYLPLAQRFKDFLDTWVAPLARKKDKLPPVAATRKARRSIVG